MKAAAEHSVNAVPELKSEQIASWLGERHGDAVVVSGDLWLAAKAQELGLGRAPTACLGAPQAPLRAVDGFSEILIEDYGRSPDATGQARLRRIRGGAQHMTDLIDGLLSLSRVNRNELHMESVDLSVLAAEVIAGLRDADRSRDVEVTIARELTAESDPLLTRVALENLLGDAWKFTANRKRAHIEVGATDADSLTWFYVRDDGAGFDMQYADSLFGAFLRLHRQDEFEGTGIGLATVRRIVHRHGGAFVRRAPWTRARRSSSRSRRPTRAERRLTGASSPGSLANHVATCLCSSM